MATKKRRGRRTDPSSKSGKVRALLTSGMTTADIAKRVGCTVALVYNIKSKAGGSKPTRGAKKRGPGRPPKAKASNIDGLGSILAAVQGAEKQRVQMRGALEKIQALIAKSLA